MTTIMIVEDDKTINNGLAFNLQCDGFNVISAFSLGEAKERLVKNEIDLIILDVNLPDGSGFDFCKVVRESYSMPILFLTACDMELDVITGFKLGADDYITKPFSLHILRERVLALLRRCGKAAVPSNKVTVGHLEVDFDKMTLCKNGENIVLSPTEYKLLKKFIQSKGEVLTRQALLETIWDKDEFIEEHALTVNINRLRNKIEVNSSKPKYIKTVYGIGYIWGGGDS